MWMQDDGDWGVFFFLGVVAALEAAFGRCKARKRPKILTVLPSHLRTVLNCTASIAVRLVQIRIGGGNVNDLAKMAGAEGKK